MSLDRQIQRSAEVSMSGYHVDEVNEASSTLLTFFTTPWQIGRILQRIKDLGKEDNTLVLGILGDNGAMIANGPGQFNSFRERQQNFNYTQRIADHLANLGKWGTKDS
jgi:hypothetical protein